MTIFKIADGKQERVSSIGLVNFDVPTPKSFVIFFHTPHVKNGFENSCSETACECALRHWNIVDWDQYRIHREGYHTFEGDVSEGDLGLIRLFNHEIFTTKTGLKIRLSAKIVQDADLEFLFHQLHKGRAPIVRIFTDRARKNKHTQVVIGYNKKGLFLNDNDDYNLENNDPSKHYWIFQDFDQFLDRWSRNTIVVKPVI